jgi:small-conductance mechanosensitive channel
VTVAGNTGKVTDITLMYTVVETETGRLYVPNSMMVNTAVLKRKPPVPPIVRP